MANWMEVNNGSYVIFNKNTSDYNITISKSETAYSYNLDIVLKSTERSVFSTTFICKTGGTKGIKDMANSLIREYARVNIQRLTELKEEAG